MLINLEEKIVELTGAQGVIHVEEIQSLWSGYGTLSRYKLFGAAEETVVVKHVCPPHISSHSRGWNTPLSHTRKLKSYQVELNWYHSQVGENDLNYKIPKCFGTYQIGDEFLIILEDLCEAGYPLVNPVVDSNNVESCIRWLANFHAKFLNEEVTGLWEKGTYWHLETRPEELAVLTDLPLKENAGKIDFILATAKYQTLVHGDAKLANFCFSSDEKSVAAVDFQYIGKGCGMKDLAYFIGSCFSEEECASMEKEILNLYFSQLTSALEMYHPYISSSQVEEEWRGLFKVAWTDFHRFLKGWSPGHWKINSYSEKISKEVTENMGDFLSEENLMELCEVAEVAALQAGELIVKMRKEDISISTKSTGSSRASRILTNADQASEKLIMKALSPSMKNYNLGLLAEESHDDLSRLEKQYFWCIDPLDGTISYAQNKKGYSVSIALVNKHGQAIIGVVYDPINAELYTAIIGKGAKRNGIPFQLNENFSDVFRLILDASFMDNPNEPRITQKFEDLADRLGVQSMDRVSYGGAVLNAINTVFNPPSCYFKEIKKAQGGGGIWDFAATSCVVKEAGGVVLNSHLEPLRLNDAHSVFMNHQGVFISSKNVIDQLPSDFVKEVTRCYLE